MIFFPLMDIMMLITAMAASSDMKSAAIAVICTLSTIITTGALSDTYALSGLTLDRNGFPLKSSPI